MLTRLFLQAVVAAKLPARKDDTGTERFLEYFYKDCVHILFKPLLELQEWKNCKGIYITIFISQLPPLTSLLQKMSWLYHENNQTATFTCVTFCTTSSCNIIFGVTSMSYRQIISYLE